MPRAALPLLLALGILAVSTASTFVRLAQESAPSLLIAAGRLGIAALVLAPWALGRHRAALGALTRGDLGPALFAGIFLALHFATWITSLEHTSVVSSVVIVTTTPLWVALLSPFVLGERITPATGLGIVLALLGGAVVAIAGPASGPGGGGRAALLGDLLALVGAWMMAGYLLAGRGLRARLPLVPYVFVVYAMAAVILWIGALAAGQRPAQAAPAAWGWIALLALVPQLVGHSSFNWALRHLPAAVVSVGLLGEPVGSALLAYLVLGETPSALEAAGAVLILCGIAVAMAGAGRTTRAAPALD